MTKIPNIPWDSALARRLLMPWGMGVILLSLALVAAPVEPEVVPAPVSQDPSPLVLPQNTVFQTHTMGMALTAVGSSLLLGAPLAVMAVAGAMSGVAAHAGPASLVQGLSSAPGARALRRGGALWLRDARPRLHAMVLEGVASALRGSLTLAGKGTVELAGLLDVRRISAERPTVVLVAGAAALPCVLLLHALTERAAQDADGLQDGLLLLGTPHLRE